MKRFQGGHNLGTHSTVDNSVMPRLLVGGEHGRESNDGSHVQIPVRPAIPAMADAAVYTSWGPGKYDPRYNQDGKNTPLVLPPDYVLAQVTNATYTAEGPISYWNGSRFCDDSQDERDSHGRCHSIRRARHAGRGRQR